MDFLQLGAREVGIVLPPVFSYWRAFSVQYVTAVCTFAGAEAAPAKMHVPVPAEAELVPWALAAPLMPAPST
ncbi:MAG: hypothetical protein ABSD20_07255 [Terriglobales bacterium]